MLNVGFLAAEVAADEFFPVGFQVAVSILHEPEIGRLADENAVGQDLDGAGEDELVHEDGAFVHATVAIGVFEYDNAADRLKGVAHFHIHREGGHLDDLEAAVRIPIHYYGVLNQRFAGDDFEFVAGRQEESLKRLIDGEGGGGLGEFLNGRRPDGFRLPG